MSLLSRILKFRISIRYWFWKMVMAYLGGTIGRDTVFYEGTKLYMTPKASMSIGDRCTLQQGVVLSAADAKMKIGNHVYFGEYVVVLAREQIEIGDNAILASHTFVVDFDHDIENEDKSLYYRFKTKKVTIGPDVWIGAGCKILKGVTIGEGAVVGAGSVVTRDLPPFSVSVGVPARVIRYRQSTKALLNNKD